MTKKKTTAHEDWLYLVWDPVNNLIHGVHAVEEAAVAQILRFASQPADHGPLHVVKAPGPTVKPAVRTADRGDVPVRAQ